MTMMVMMAPTVKDGRAGSSLAGWARLPRQCQEGILEGGAQERDLVLELGAHDRGRATRDATLGHS